MSVSSPTIALVYDRVNTAYGGAENVLVALHQTFPEAPLFTSVYNQKKAAWAQGFAVKPSFLNWLPFAKQNHRFFAPLMPLAFETHDFSQFDIIISVSSAEAKGVLTSPHQLHLNYLLSPPRHLYSHQELYQTREKVLTNPALKPFTRPLLKYMRWWDQAAVHRPDVIIPISELVKARIKDFYQIVTEPVIYPPVRIPAENDLLPNAISAELEKNLLPPFYLVISRLLHYKKIELAIEACQHLNRKLVIVGSGPELKNLQQQAGKNLFIVQDQPQTIVDHLYRQCRALIIPGEEDFGIVGLEANSFGKPVIVFTTSGVAEVIKDQVHGWHLKEQSVKALTKAMLSLEQTKFEPAVLKKNAARFAQERFTQEFKQVVLKHWQSASRSNKTL